MKVKEFIKKLQEFDPELEVVDYEYNPIEDFEYTQDLHTFDDVLMLR